jgi:hypothetical protein
VPANSSFLKINKSFLPFLCFLLTGCEALKESPKYEFGEGYYTYKVGSQKFKKVYVVPGIDSIKVYNQSSLASEHIDTVRSVSLVFPQNRKPKNFKEYKFKKNSYDINLVTIVAKCHPSIAGFPIQLYSSFNGAFYMGYRSDVYELSYSSTPLKVDKRETEHHGYSLGVFLGMGTSHVDQYVTSGFIDYEYDGFNLQAGSAFTMALNRLNFGVAVGWDYLLDRNKTAWIYQTKPWIGLSVGLNIEK